MNGIDSVLGRILSSLVKSIDGKTSPSSRLALILNITSIGIV